MTARGAAISDSLPEKSSPSLGAVRPLRTKRRSAPRAELAMLLRESSSIIWKRCGSGKPQQDAADMCD
jgi:hypothetical protein